jgi:hypothetical protein
MIRYKDYCEGEGLRRLDLKEVFGNLVFGPIYTFKVGGQDIIDKALYNYWTENRTGVPFKKSDYERRMAIKCTRTKHYFTSPKALHAFLRSHKLEFKDQDWIDKNCSLVKDKDKIIVWSL